jgi:hypothetical protein
MSCDKIIDGKSMGFYGLELYLANHTMHMVILHIGGIWIVLDPLCFYNLCHQETMYALLRWHAACPFTPQGGTTPIPKDRHNTLNGLYASSKTPIAFKKWGIDSTSAK